MKRKTFLLIILILTCVLLLSACGSQSKDLLVEAPMEMMNSMAADSRNADFSLPIEAYHLESDETRIQVEDYLITLNNKLNIENDHYAIGDLDGDLVSEIVIYIERQKDNVDDPGALQVYKYYAGSYSLLDSVSMNYDNTNYGMKIGMLSESTSGIYLSNQVGSQAGITYGFTMLDGKLVPVLNPKKINLFSVSTSNGIEDIDQDGILEFSVYTIDPETSEKNTKDADKILLWYKWDEKDAATVVQRDWVMNFTNMSLSSSQERVGIMVIEDPPPNPGGLQYISELEENMKDMTKQEVSDSLDTHLSTLLAETTYRSLDVSSLFGRYFKDYSFDVVFEKYGLSEERLNDIEYLKRERVLQSEPDLKNLLIKNLGLGYKLSIDNGRYLYVIDYDKFLSKFSEYITNEYKSYLRIMGRETTTPHIKANSSLIKKEKLADRLLEIEKFRLTYSYSSKLSSILALYEKYSETLLYNGDLGNTFDQNGKFVKESRDQLLSIMDNYKDTHFADVIESMITKVDATINKSITDEIKIELQKKIP